MIPSCVALMGGKQVEVDATGRPVAEVDRKHTVPGANIHLTIDANLQKAAEEAVKNQLEQLRAQVFQLKELL